VGIGSMTEGLLAVFEKTRMRRVALLVFVIFIGSAQAKADSSNCVSDFAARRLRLAMAHQHHGDAPTNSKANCRVYGISFYEAVVARQAAATCGQGTERQRILDALDSEINVFNGLIAAQCAI
jgi:hypothetical protein